MELQKSVTPMKIEHAWTLERRKRMVTCLAHESLKWCFNLTHYF